MKPIEKLSDYMEFIENLPEGFILSRGQRLDYPLLPSALRLDDKGNKKYTRQAIAYFLNEFKENSHHYMPAPWDVKNDYEWMIYAQHYGLPTRLLDFTYSHILSLMFAVQNSFNEELFNDSVVWFLNPKKLNLKNCRRSELISVSAERDVKLDDYGGPVAIQGRKLNVRINIQNGVFVYFQDISSSLDSEVADEEILRKLIIKGENKKDILSSLYSLGIGLTQIYPELDSVAKDILVKACIKQYQKEGEQL